MSRMMNDVRVKRPSIGRAMPKVEVKKSAKRIKLSLSLPRLKFRRFDPRRPLHWAVVVLIVAGVSAPIAGAMLTAAKYRIDSADVARVLAAPSSKYQAKYDPSQQAYVFNSDSNNVSDQSQQVGGSGYKAVFPTNSQKGISITDNTSGLALSFTPLGQTLDAKSRSGHIVYPQNSANSKIVYTTKANGVKEDILLQQEQGDTVTFKYRLDLPTTLEARITPNGTLGLYSADPSLFGNISFGSDADRAAVNKARQSGAKDHLAFVVPAPTINQAYHDGATPSAKFSLDGNVLTVTASGLADAAYPLSIDPSFVVTSVNDFKSGNAEDNITFDSNNNQISRGILTGGSVGSWGSTTAFDTTGRYAFTTEAYNGYLYVIGGFNTARTADVRYAPINSSTGTVGAWAATTSLPQAWAAHQSFIYNGYLYVAGGYLNGGQTAQVIYAKINADGTLGSWASTNSMPHGTFSGSATVYNNHVYVTGNGGGSNTQMDIGAIHPDHSITWTTDTNTYPARFGAPSLAYNGYLYLIGGLSSASGTPPLNDVQYTKINSDGSLNAWHTTSSFNTARGFQFASVKAGYIYIGGGCTAVSSGTCTTNINDVQYAQINADGTLGSWITTNPFSTARTYPESVEANGYLYSIGGCTTYVVGFGTCSGGLQNDVQYAKIASAGELSASQWTTTSPFNGENCNGSNNNVRDGVAIAVYNGYIYAAGGFYSCLGIATGNGTVEYAPINADGSLGAWTTTSSIGTSSRMDFGLVADNGYIYAIGGCTSWASGSCGSTINDWYSASISSNGSLGTWNQYGGGATDNMNQSRAFMNATVYAGYIYVGVGANAAGISYSTVEYAQITGGGTLGAWKSDTNTISGSTGQYSRVEAWGGTLIYIPGADSTAIQYITINSDGSLQGPWKSGTPMLTGLHAMSTAVSNGVLYVIGGINGSTAQTAVYMMPLDGGGGPTGAWSTVTHIPTASACADSVATGGNLYLIGVSSVCTPSATAETDAYISINNGGSGQLQSTWTTNANSLNSVRFFQSTVAYRGHVYVMGGCSDVSCATVLNSVETAAFNPDGSIGAFSNNSANNLPSNKRGMSAAAMDGYIYALGGASGGISNSVLYTKINGDGSLEAPPGGAGCTGIWCTLSSFSVSRSGETAAAYNGYLYVVGGCDSNSSCSTAANITNSVEYTQVNQNNGSLNAPAGGTGCAGPWCTTSSISVGKFGLAAAVNDGRIYTAGGCYVAGATLGARCATGQASNTVEYAVINGNGSLGSWQFTNQLLTSVFYFDLDISNGFIYAIGGLVSGNNDTVTEVAPIDANGGVEPWTNTTILSQSKGSPGGLAYNGFIYTIGGWDNNATVYSSVTYVGQQAIPRIAHYSKEFDAGNDVIASKLWLAGNSYNGHTSLSYETSTSAANSFGSATTVDPLSYGQLNSLSAGDNTARYYFMYLTLDDSQSAVFPDSAGTETISDLIFYFHPAPFNRLRGGKTLGVQGCNFTGGTNCQLDASP